jgi:hypothetical protein
MVCDIVVDNGMEPVQLGLAAPGEGFFIGKLLMVVAGDAATTTTGLALGICLPHVSEN